jgi:hypothetical protein
MSRIGKTCLVSAIVAAALAFAISNASAAVVCDDDGDCWHVHSDYDYPHEAGVIVHPDTWAWNESDHYRWREHEGRGYWHGDAWVPF